MQTSTHRRKPQYNFRRALRRTGRFEALKADFHRRRFAVPGGFPADGNFVFAGNQGLFKPLQVQSELCQLLGIIQKMQSTRVLEIGTASGGTLFLLARAASPDALLMSLDLPTGDGGCSVCL